MEAQKFGVKFFAEDPRAVKAEEFIPVFHRWIQTRRVEGILIDVADYSHLPEGPGVVLIGHEADYFMDASEGPLGLLYNRKQPLAGSPSERIGGAFRAALRACELLEEDFEGRLKFRRDEALFLVNDRLLAPNTEETFAAARPHLGGALASLFPGRKVDLRRMEGDPRRRFAVRVKL